MNCLVDGRDLSEVVLFNGGGRASPEASPNWSRPRITRGANGSASGSARPMPAEAFGTTADGRPVTRHVLSRDGLRVAIIDFGAAVTAIEVRPTAPAIRPTSSSASTPLAPTRR